MRLRKPHTHSLAPSSSTSFASPASRGGLSRTLTGTAAAALTTVLIISGGSTAYAIEDSPVILPHDGPMSEFAFDIFDVHDDGRTDIPIVADLEFTHSVKEHIDNDNSSTVTPGDVLVFELRAVNTGTIFLENLELSESLTGNSETKEFLSEEREMVLTTEYVVTQADAEAGVIVSTGTVTSSMPEPQSRTIEVEVFPSPPVTVDPTPEPATGPETSPQPEAGAHTAQTASTGAPTHAATDASQHNANLALTGATGNWGVPAGIAILLAIGSGAWLFVRRFAR